MTDLFTADLNSLDNGARYSAIAAFAQAQPTESNRHDFKTLWNNEALKDVAAFANTFGGILIIGIQKGQTDVAAILGGVESNSELTTGIASAIATNISPNPSFDIVECYEPGKSNRRFCVVRIRNDATLHLVTKKGVSNPVWFRNADQTIAADAAQLRMMIDREKQTSGNAERAVFDRANNLFAEMKIGNYMTPAGWPDGPMQWSDTSFSLALIPKEQKSVVLDVRSEREFVALIHQHYRRVQFLLSGVAAQELGRSSEFYEYRWYHKNIDHECRWRVSDDLAVAHTTQVKEDEEWSLLDVVEYVILLLTVGAKWWESLGYFGEGILVARLSVPRLRLARGASHQFKKLFGPGKGDYGLNAEVLDEHPQRPTADGTVAVNFASMRDGIPEIVTSLMNSLLRSLGHGVSWNEFKKDVEIIANGCV